MALSAFPSKALGTVPMRRGGGLAYAIGGPGGGGGGGLFPGGGGAACVG
jgi:hypothetical protein